MTVALVSLLRWGLRAFYPQGEMENTHHEHRAQHHRGRLQRQSPERQADTRTARQGNQAANDASARPLQLTLLGLGALGESRSSATRRSRYLGRYPWRLVSRGPR